MPDNNNNPVIITKKNINKDYLVTVNARTATLSAGNITFYVTDRNTSNIFFKLEFRDPEDNPNSLLINQYVPEESATYDMYLRIINPNNTPMERVLQPLDYKKNYYYIDLEDDYKNYIGTYTCELFIETYINRELERRTTNSFTYTVVGSIMNELDEEVEADPDYPLLDSVLDNYKEMVREQAAECKEIVEKQKQESQAALDEQLADHQAILNQAVIDIQLLDYATNTEVNSRIAKAHETPLVGVHPINGVLTLTKDTYQKVKVPSNTTIKLPTVSEYKEIHLFITADSEAEIILPKDVKCQNIPVIEADKVYEYIFTYIGQWLVGAIVYE